MVEQADSPSHGEFTSEYRLELESWLRRRFRNLCITFLVLGVLDLAVHLIATPGDQTPVALLLLVAGRSINIAVICWFLFGRDWSGADRDEILRATSRMIVIIGTIALLGRYGIQQTATGDPPNLILPVFLWHFTACLFLPWTPRESVRPFVPLLIVWAVLTLLFSSQPTLPLRIAQVVLGPMVLLPGLGIAAWRMKSHIRDFRTRMVGQIFTTMRREFSQARSIHESLFPQPYDDGFVRFEYTYTPMRELGGDFIHLHVGAEGLIHLTLIDVTGHGLAAALTVNRLYGELERIRAESPRADPGEVLTLLNRYIHLTMTKHNIYATAACIMLDPYSGELHWASGGHPPGFVRGETGGIRSLAATTVPLGAFDDEAFDADEQKMDLSPGDMLLLFTDGAFESRDRQGRDFGLDRLRELVAIRPPPRSWSKFVAAAVDKHAAGHCEDDVLIASLTFNASRQAREEEESEQVAAAT